MPPAPRRLPAAPAPGPAAAPPAPAPRPPQVRLGRTHPDGIAAGVVSIVERGVQRRPEVAAALRGKVVFRWGTELAPLRVSFGARVIRVEDADLRRPQLAIEGRLPDIVHVATAPRWLGLPSLREARGRAAIAHVARRRVKLTGDLRLARGVLALLKRTD